MTRMQKVSYPRAQPGTPSLEPSPDGAGRRERRRVETRERLYEAAMTLLSERDFEAVTIEMITEAADVGKGTFFNHFANKEAIVGYRYERTLPFLTEMLQPAPSVADGRRGEESRSVDPRRAGHAANFDRDASSRRAQRTQ